MRRPLPILFALLAGSLTLACNVVSAPQPTAEPALPNLTYRIGHTAASDSLLDVDGHQFTAEKHNLVVLAYWENGFRHFTNNVRPIRVPGDLSGLRVRTPPDPDRIELFHLWGAKPSPLDLNQLFDAFRAGVFDGQENPVANIISQRLYEVQHYASMTGHIYSPSYVIASKQWWDSLD